ncbi:MAG: serine/threonine-protein kinase [Myxococcota bacterium]
MLARYGRYETLRKIASGGMATVYLGRVSGEGGFERLVALKVMHAHIANDPDFVSMFLDEARLAAQIRHPNVVATLDIQKSDASMFLVMDFVDGPTLQEMRKHLKSNGERIPIETVLRIFVDVLSGLQEAHDLRDKHDAPMNLVHRDVSPHNVLVGKDGVARLTDFGVARAEARISTTRGGQLKGKIAYMAPEQIMGLDVDRRADIYSAGACLWEMLTGRRLWRAANEGALVHAILEGNPPSPSAFADVPAALEQVVMKALATEADERYAEALDMADALEAAAREADLRIPRRRDVGRFVRGVCDAMGRENPGDGERAARPPEDHTPASGADRPVDSRAALRIPDDAASQPSAVSNVAASGSSGPAGAAGRAADPAVASAGVVARGSMATTSSSGVTLTPGQAGMTSSAAASGSRPLRAFEDQSQPSVVTSPTQATSTYTLEPLLSRSGFIAVVVTGAVALVAVVFIGLANRGDPEGDTAFHAYSYAGSTAGEKAASALDVAAHEDDAQDTTDTPSADGDGEEDGDDPTTSPRPTPKTVPKRPLRPPPSRPARPRPVPSPKPGGPYRPPTL